MNDMDVVTTIAWVVGDIRDALESNGFDPGDGNVQKFIDENASHLRDRSIELGYDVLYDLIAVTDLEPLNDDEEED